MVCFNPHRPDFEPYGFTCVRWSPSTMLRPDRHNEIEINYLEDGSLTYLFGDKNLKVEAKRFTIFWAALPHQIVEHHCSSNYFVATLPLAWFLHCKLPDQMVQPLLNGHILSVPQTELTEMGEGMLARWERDFFREGSDYQRAVLLELEAFLLRLGLSCPEWKNPTPISPKRRLSLEAGAVSKAEQMARFIAEDYTKPITVELIAKCVGLHPNYAMSLFHRVFGTTLVAYVTENRIAHARRLLSTTNMKVLDIAEASGFGSLSRFNEAFRQHCGCSPREYRQKLPLRKEALVGQTLSTVAENEARTPLAPCVCWQ